jgi:probable HAF family extracellular repeat protein
LIALCLAGPGAVVVYAGTPQYAFSSVDVPAELGAFTSAYGLNNAGVLVGNFVTPEENLDGFIFEKGVFIDVIVPGATSDSRGALNDINDFGQAVGGFTDADTGIEHSFVRSKSGEFTVLPDVPDAVLTEATAINNLGDIVGFYFDADFAPHGFILRGGVYTTYDYPGSTRTILTRINERGQITGIRRDPDGHRRGFVLQNGVTTTIDVPGSRNTRTGGINNQGHVVGYYDDADLISHGFLFKDGVFTTLDFPGASDTALLDINDRGVIAGTYDAFSRGLVAAPVK